MANHNSDVPTLKAIIEAVLFTAGGPLTLSSLCKHLPEYSRAEIKTALKELTRDYDAKSRGMELVQVAGGYRLQTRRELKKWILRLKRVPPLRLSKASLETLALIAYRQPATRAEIEEIRGVDSSGTLRFLLEKKLIRISGRKSVPGRPLLYQTTRHFLQIFQLDDLSSMPTIKELIELEEGNVASQPPLFDPGVDAS